MKKVYILAFLCLVSVASARAQYHITGDTVQNYDSTWWVPEWYKVWLDPANMPPKTIWGLTGSWGGFAGEYLIRHVAERPIRVIGIAVCATTYQMGVPGEMGDTMTSAQEYLLIYRSRDKGGEEPLRVKPWDPTAPHRYVSVTRLTSTNSCDTAIYGYTNIEPMYEVYFEDNPLVITDTFFIGMTFHSDAEIFNTIMGLGWGVIEGNYTCGGFPPKTWVRTPDYSSSTVTAGVPIVNEDDPNDRDLWYIFPILSQDTDFSLLDSCPAAGQVWLDSADGGSLLRWEGDSLHTYWQVNVGDTGTAAGTPWLDTLVETPFLDLASYGFVPPYAVQVRPHCLCYEYYEVWGDWGNCLEILPPPEPDTCRPVEGLQYIGTGYGQGTLVWTPDTLHTLWQVAIGDTGSAPNEAWIDTLVASPFLAVDSLGLASAFTAHVRALCGSDNWSEWSEGVFADPFVGIADVEGEALRTRLMPNPADGLVHASASSTLKGVEVYDLSGRRMLTLDTEGNEVAFDVSAWPTATYIVILRTVQGPAVHRLAVR